MAHKRNDIPITISFSENSKGWTSFKSFLKENGISLNNRYYTFKSGHLWEHNENETRGSFYGGTVQPNGLWSNIDSSFSHIKVLFNDAPGSVKSFGTLNYEGSQAKNTPDITNDAEYYNNFLKLGWYVEEIETNLQNGVSLEFKNKEGKWFSKIKGEATEWLADGKAGNIDTREFSVQGIGNNSEITCPECPTVFTSWDCEPGTSGVPAGEAIGDCTDKTFIAIPSGSTWDDFGELTTNPANGHTSTPPDQIGTCLLPYTGWGRTGPFTAAINSGITNHFDWVTQWCASPLGLGTGNTTCCSCGSNSDGVYVYGYRYYLIECRTLKALGPPDPGENPCNHSYSPPLTGNPITGATYAWNQNHHLNTTVANYTSWEGFLTKLLTLQPSLGTTYGVSLATTDLAALTIALNQFYSDINTNDPKFEYHWEMPNVESRVCDCEHPGSGTLAVPGTPCSCVERQDMLGQYMTEHDCLIACCPELVTSWNCITTPSTSSSIFTCAGQLPYNGVEVNVGSMFNDMFEYNQYISDPLNNLTNTPFTDFYACVERGGTAVTYNSVAISQTGTVGTTTLTTHGMPIPITACECNNGLGVLVNARGPLMPPGIGTWWPTMTVSYVPSTWNDWIAEINSWGMSPPIPSDTPYDQVILLVDAYMDGYTSGLYATSGGQSLPPIAPWGNDFCLCEGDPGGGGCTCVEVLDASGTYPTESSCLTQCCNVTLPNPSWDCVNGNCIDPGTGAGQYTLLSSCTVVCGASTSTVECDWEQGGQTTGLPGFVSGTTLYGAHVNRPGASNGSNVVPFNVTGGTVIDDPTVFFSTHPGGNSWTYGANSSTGFPGWILDDSYMLRRTGSSSGDIIKMPSGRCWEFHNTTFPPQQQWNIGQNYPTQTTNAGSYNGPYQVPYWHTYLGRNPEVPGNEDWWRECSCNT